MEGFWHYKVAGFSVFLHRPFLLILPLALKLTIEPCLFQSKTFSCRVFQSSLSWLLRVQSTLIFSRSLGEKRSKVSNSHLVISSQFFLPLHLCPVLLNSSKILWEPESNRSKFERTFTVKLTKDGQCIKGDSMCGTIKLWPIFHCLPLPV